MTRSRYISTPAVYFLFIAITLTLSFELFRLLDLIILSGRAEGIPAGDILFSFIAGLRFDFSITSYIVLPLYLLSILPLIDIERNRYIRGFISLLLILLTAAVFLLHTVDIAFLRTFNARLNDYFIKWSEHPEASTNQLWGLFSGIAYLLLWGAVLTAFVCLNKKLNGKLFKTGQKSPVWTHLLYLPLLLVIFGYGARGRIGAEEPMRWGLAYFSAYDFANTLALNPVFTFTRDVFFDAPVKAETAALMREVTVPNAENITRRLLDLPEMTPATAGQRLKRPVRFDPPSPNPPNVILIIMESFGSSKIGVLDNFYPYDITPCFDSLAGEGLLFTNFYSCGERTFASLIAALYGYPPQYGKLIVKQVPGQNHFWGLPSVLKANSYRTEFYTTSDPHFDNMQGFLMANGISKVYSMYDMGEEQSLSWMGVPDHVMFDYAYNRLKAESNDKFFSLLLSASNHGPWLLPDVPFGKFPDSLPEAHKLNAFKYSDWALGRFVRQIQNDPAFDNTYIVITGDNGSPYDKAADLEITHYQIPLLILKTGDQGIVSERNTRLGSHLDLFSTLMGLLRMDYDNYSFGKDLLDTVAAITDFAHFTEKDKIGHVENGYYLINRLHGPEALYKLPDKKTDIAAQHPDIVEDFHIKSTAIFQTAYYNMTRPLDTASQHP
ncbi:MAG: LTA synthase family protein [Candidatus Zixiibacteriota bacterium]